MAIFNATTNLKHYMMLSLMFYCLLRAGDIINLEDDDIDLKTMTLRIRDGKFGKSAILPIPQACVQTLEQYLQVRPCIASINILILRTPANRMAKVGAMWLEGWPGLQLPFSLTTTQKQ